MCTLEASLSWKKKKRKRRTWWLVLHELRLTGNVHIIAVALGITPDGLRWLWLCSKLLVSTFPLQLKNCMLTKKGLKKKKKASKVDQSEKSSSACLYSRNILPFITGILCSLKQNKAVKGSISSINNIVTRMNRKNTCVSNTVAVHRKKNSKSTQFSKRTGCLLQTQKFSRIYGYGMNCFSYDSSA